MGESGGGGVVGGWGGGTLLVRAEWQHRFTHMHIIEYVEDDKAGKAEEGFMWRWSGRWVGEGYYFGQGGVAASLDPHASS